MSPNNNDTDDEEPSPIVPPVEPSVVTEKGITEAVQEENTQAIIQEEQKSSAANVPHDVSTSVSSTASSKVSGASLEQKRSLNQPSLRNLTSSGPPKGFGAKGVGGGSSEALVNLALKQLNGKLVVRSFEPKDTEQIRSICFSHFRSSCLAAVRFYIAEHLQDLGFLCILGLIFLSWKKFLLAILLFQLYLVARAKLQVESYIRKDCADLKDIKATYLSCGDAAHFWVAELIPNPTTTGIRTPGAPGPSGVGEAPEKEETVPEGVILGCVGLIRSREDESLAKVVRLVVKGSHRRLRIGSRLLSQLENFAEDVGYAGLRMYTNTLNPTHVKFVRQHGFTLVQTIRRGLMRGDLITWHKPLSNEAMLMTAGSSLSIGGVVDRLASADGVDRSEHQQDGSSGVQTPVRSAYGPQGVTFHSVAQTVMD